MTIIMRIQPHVVFRLSFYLLIVGKFLLVSTGEVILPTLFSNENAIRPVVDIFSSWQHYTSTFYPWLSVLFLKIELFYWVSVILFSLFRYTSKISCWLIILYAVIEILTFSISTHLGWTMFFTKAIFIGLPLAILFQYSNLHNRILLVTLIFVFVGHGLLALSYWPRPGAYDDMVISWMRWFAIDADFFLKIIGALDLLSVFCILGMPRFHVYGLYWLCIWGMLTACARIYNIFISDIDFNLVRTTIGDVFIRLPHGLIPLYLILIKSKRF